MNGSTDPLENGIHTSEDVDMSDDTSKAPKKLKSGEDNDGDEEMTVVVPPSKGSKASEQALEDVEDDITMKMATEAEDQSAGDSVVDHRARAIAGEYRFAIMIR